MKTYFYLLFFLTCFVAFPLYSQDNPTLPEVAKPTDSIKSNLPDTTKINDTIKPILPQTVKPVDSIQNKTLDNTKLTDSIKNKVPETDKPITNTNKTDVVKVLENNNKPAIINYWTTENKVGLDISENAFFNWNAGGNNSIAGLLKGNFTRLYKHGNLKWNNELVFRYGVNKQDGAAIKKTEDAIQINSTFGYRTDSISNWYYTGKYNFNTQFTNGYAYPNTSKAISKYFAPAYVFLGVGTEYSSKKNKFNLYFSPLTLKTTLVLDEDLSNQGAYGVTKATYDSNGDLITRGKSSKTELGALFTLYHKDELYKNVVVENRLGLYSDYVNKFGNIDIDWQLQVDFVVNQYIRANIVTHILYDDDIKAKKEIDGKQTTIGPKIQLKQILGIGLSYSF